MSPNYACIYLDRGGGVGEPVGLYSLFLMRGPSLHPSKFIYYIQRHILEMISNLFYTYVSVFSNQIIISFFMFLWWGALAQWAAYPPPPAPLPLHTPDSELIFLLIARIQIHDWPIFKQGSGSCPKWTLCETLFKVVPIKSYFISFGYLFQESRSCNTC